MAKRLLDANRAAAAIERFTAGMNAAGYLRDELVQSAVERQLEIVKPRGG